jgi:hypothetical protein
VLSLGRIHMLSLVRIRYLLLVLFLSLLVGHFAGATDWPPITPEEQAIKDVPQLRGAPAVILDRQEVADDRNHYHSTYMRIKVLTEAGREYADVVLPYNRRDYTIEQVSGRTVHADGSVVPFEGKPFDKTIVKFHGIRYQVKAFTLPDVQAGSIVDFRYSLRYGDTTALPPEWIVQNELFQKKSTFKFIPFKGAVFLQHNQVAKHVIWSTWLPPGVQPQEHYTTRSDWFDLSLTDVPPIVEEPYMPVPDTLKWYVKFSYQVSTNAEDYWKDQGKFWNKDVQNFLGKKKGISETVGQTISATDTTEQKVRRLYALVAGMENQSYRPPRLKQEEKALGLKPNEGVGDVLRQKSGDHDDLNRLFAALVREAGIPAWLMWVPGRDQGVFQATYLSTSQFDAEIAIVRLNGKDVFLDPGTKFCPYGVMDWRYASTRGLRQREGEGSELADTPSPDYQSTKTTRVANVRLTQDGNMEGTITVAFYGQEAMNRRQEGGKTDAEGQKRMLEDEIKGWLPAGAEVTLSKIPLWQEIETPLVADFQVSSPLAVMAGRGWMIPSHLFQVNREPIFSAANRVNAVYFYYPWTETDEVQITLPQTATVEGLPHDEEIRLEFAVYRAQQREQPPNVILSRRDLVVGRSIFPPAMYKEVKDFFDKTRMSDDKPILLKETSHAQGNWRRPPAGVSINRPAFAIAFMVKRLDNLVLMTIYGMLLVPTTVTFLYI